MPTLSLVLAHQRQAACCC